MGKKQHSIIFMGTPEFAIDSLQILLEHNYDVLAVVTSPDKPAGRGKKIKTSAIKDFAVKNKLVVLQPFNLKDHAFIEELKELNADLFVVVAFRMLPKSVWSIPPKGTINLHASLLPQYRGAAPINWVLINGETESGLTTFYINEKIDTGEIIDQVKLELNENLTFGELHDVMKVKGAHLIEKTVKNIFDNKVTPKSQVNSGTLKLAPKIQRQDCELDWSKNKFDIYNKVRGLSPSPGSYTYIYDDKGYKRLMKILSAEISEETNENLEPGEIKTDGRTFIAVAAKDGYLKLNEIQLEGKRKMNCADLLNGMSITNTWKCISH